MGGQGGSLPVPPIATARNRPRDLSGHAGAPGNYRELKHGLGLDHFEGRTYTGWHRHVTLVSVAQAFCTLLRLDPKVLAPA